MSGRATPGGDGGATPPVLPGLRMAALVLLAAGGAACTTEFEPVAPGDLGFSVWGYVDPGLDTQWVRVGRVRRTVAPDPEAFRASVTLVEVETGRRWPMRDSTFTFFSGYRAVNVWAAAPVEPGRRYRIEVEGDDGLWASAEAAVPPRPEVGLQQAPAWAPARVTLYDVARVEGVVASYTCTLPSGATDTAPGFRNVYRRGAEGRTTDVVAYWSEAAFACSQGGGEITAAAVQVTVLGDDWPDLRGLSFDGANVPSRSSNVAGGEGFFGGATTLRVPIFEGVPAE